MNSSPLSQERLVVFGGRNGWGKKITQTCRDGAHSVAVVDLDTPENEALQSVREASTIFLAAPDSEIQQILLSHREALQGKSILDCATNKSGFATVLTDLSKTSSTCSTHPMVRSETSSRGQKVLVMPVGEQAKQATLIAKDIFARLEMNIRDFPFEKHGDLMTILQFVPHLVQRVLLGTMTQVLQAQGLSIKEVEDVAPPNFMMTELGMGRVAIQKPSVSAGIVLEHLRSNFGQKILSMFQEQLDAIVRESDRGILENKFDSDVLTIGQDWKQHMDDATDVLIEAMGNLNARSFQLVVHRNEPGLLGKVCAILGSRNINMTAMHSSVSEDQNGQESVRFDVGIDDCDVDWLELEKELEVHDIQLIR